MSKLIHREDFLKFLRNKPRKKKVEFSEFSITDPVGCVMVQYGKEKGIDFDTCSSKSWFKGRVEVSYIGLDIDSLYQEEIKTYGDVQDLIKEIFPEEPNV